MNLFSWLYPEERTGNMMMVDIVMLFLTSGLWLVWMFIRHISKRGE
jgi:hypothetical protein